MKTKTLSDVPGETTYSAKKIELKNKAVDSALYQKALYLRLIRPDGSDYLQLDSQQTSLNISFDTLEYNALSTQESGLRATVTKRSNMLIVEFPEPVNLSAIELDKRIINTPDKILIYRVDGEAIAEQASATAYHTPPMLAQAAISKNEAVVKAMTAPVTHAEKPASKYKQTLPPLQPKSHHHYHCNINGNVFALELSKPATDGFEKNWLSGLHIHSNPRTPSISLVAPEFDQESQQLTLDKGSTSLISLQAGELGSKDTPNPGKISLQQSFAQALEKALQRLQTTLEQHGNQQNIDFKLVINSGSPCIARLSDLYVQYFAVKQCCFSNQKQKISLKFKDALPETQQISFDIPEVDTINEAILKIDQSFNKSEINTSTLMAEQMEQLTSSFQSSQGITANPGESLLQPFMLNEANVLNRVWLALSATSDHTVFSVAIVSDLDNKPEGDTALTVPDISVDLQITQWVSLFLSGEKLLVSGKYWLVINVHQGQLAWHVITKTKDSIQHLNPQGIMQQFEVLQGLYLLEKGTTFGGTGTASNTGSNPKLLVRIDNKKLPLISMESTQPDTIHHYDMRSSINGMKGPIQLEFFASRHGVITVYAPTIIYEK